MIINKEDEEFVYDDFKFITKEQVETLQLNHLIGTKTLRPWMHGYFIDAKMYDTIKASIQPSAFQEWRKKQIQQKLQNKREERIKLKDKSKAKVNAMLEDNNTLMKDSRFVDLFNDPAFSINENSEEYKQMFPSGRKKRIEKEDDSEEGDGEDDDDDRPGRGIGRERD